jgi:prepilin-type N-terminal cleavage/methylation domain-containing protein
MRIAHNGFTIIELMLVVSIISIVAALSVPNYLAMQARAKEAEVIGLAHLVQLACEDFCVRNDGIYSELAADIVPCLPNHGLLRNPFTGNYTEPQFGTPATTKGQVGLQLVQTGGHTSGYVISGYGYSEEVIRYQAGY